MLPGALTGSSIIFGSNESGCPAKFSSRPTDWNVSFLAVMIRTSTETNPLVSERNPVFHLGLAVGGAIRTSYGSPQAGRRERLPRFRCDVVSDNAGFRPSGRFSGARSPRNTASGHFSGIPTYCSCVFRGRTFTPTFPDGKRFIVGHPGSASRRRGRRNGTPGWGRPTSGRTSSW
jgi:hypothetical protein